MTNVQSTSSPGQNFAPDQTVQTSAQESQWMFLHDASEATGLSEKTLRRYIKTRKVKSRRLGKQTNSPLQILVTADLLKEVTELDGQEATDAEFVDVDDNDEIDASLSQAQEVANDVDFNVAPPDELPTQLDRVLQTITQQFIDKLDQQRELNFELRRELDDKERQLRLLPDLQKKLEEKDQMAVFEREALLRQIDELKNENGRLAEEAAKAKVPPKESFWRRWFMPQADS